MDIARATFGMDKKTILLVFDPTAPNVFGYDYIGDDVLLGPLRRPFWIELQSRFGNMFYVQENVCSCCSLWFMQGTNAEKQHTVYMCL
jgi:hypothetical protein